MAESHKGTNPPSGNCGRPAPKTYLSNFALGVSFQHVLCLVRGSLSRKKATYTATSLP